MKPYSAIFFSEGQYRHILADSFYEAHQHLTDFTIPQLVEPVGIYNALTDQFTFHPDKAAQMLTFIDSYKRSIQTEIRLGIRQLRKVKRVVHDHTAEPIVTN